MRYLLLKEQAKKAITKKNRQTMKPTACASWSTKNKKGNAI
jgi:hypothetical protein